MTDLNRILCYENFDGRSGKLENIPDFGSCDNGTIENSGDGKIGQTWIGRGKEGWGEWGYSWKNDDLRACQSGDEAWCRIEIFMPNDFSVNAGSGRMKMFRFGRRKKSNDDNRGYIDWYISNGSNNLSWQAIVEMAADPPGQDTGWVEYSSGRVKKGRKQMFEFYTYFHPTNGVTRAWCDGVLFADTRRETMQSDAYLERLLFLTMYNEGSPKTQGLQFDHHTVAVKNSRRNDTAHLSTDANGNKFIGMDIEGGVSEPGEPIDPPTDIPNTAPVTDLTVSRITDSSMRLTWKHPGGDFDGYAVNRRLPGKLIWEWLALLEQGTETYSGTDMPAGTLIEWRVAAGNEDGSAPSDWVFIEATTTGGTGPVDPPVDPVDPPVDPVDPPVDIEPGANVATIQVHDNAVYVTTDLDVVVLPVDTK
jgi:hypothetical protein